MFHVTRFVPHAVNSMKYKPRKKQCGKNGCKNPRRKRQRTCKACHAAAMRDFRAQRVYVKRDAPTLPKSIAGALEQGQTLETMVKTFKRKVLLTAAKVENGNLCRAADRLGVHRNTVNRAMRQAGLRSQQVRQYLKEVEA
jgi:DNA-binding NtrC family response regulator